MKIMKKDIFGNPVEAGDILLELGRGYGSDGKGNRTYLLKLWQKPPIDDGSGYVYSIDGTKHVYWWASSEKSIKVDMELMPNGFKYSFLHGMSEFNTTIENGSFLDLISNSDWKQHEVKKEEVERFEFMKSLKIEKIEDIVSNIEELKKGGYVPHEIVSKVLELTGVGRTRVNNGEIGIAGMYDQLHYHDIIEIIYKKKKQFELL